MNHEVRRASVEPRIALNIPDNVVNNYVIRQAEDGLEHVERKFSKSNKGKSIMITSY